MKNVGILIYSLGGGGAEMVACRMVEILKENYNMYMFVMRDDNIKYDCACEVINLGAGGKNALTYELNTAKRLNKTLKEKKIDVLISLMEASNQLNLLFNHTAKSILSVHCYFGKELWEDYQNSLKDKRERFFVKHFYKNADQIAVLTKVGKEAYMRDYGLSGENINVINNPYDIPEIQGRMSEDIKSEIKDFIDTHDTTVSVGRIAVQKNYFQLIDVFEKLREKNEKAGLLILGTGPLEQELKEYINKKGLSDSIFMAGFVSNPYACISKCKMFLSVSNYEGFPNVMVETMACGIPVAYSDCFSGPREILGVDAVRSDHVIRTELGLLLPDIGNAIEAKVPAMTEEISKEWNKLLLDDERRAVYSKNALERIDAFSYENVKNRWVEIIEKVLA